MMGESPGWNCAAVWWARKRVVGQAQWTVLLHQAGEVGGCTAPLSWRGKLEESEVGGGTVTHQSLQRWEGGKHPYFCPQQEEEVRFCQYVMWWCPVCLQRWLPPVPHCCDVEPLPDCGLWREGSTSDLYETLPFCSWTTPRGDRVHLCRFILVAGSVHRSSAIQTFKSNWKNTQTKHTIYDRALFYICFWETLYCLL